MKRYLLLAVLVLAGCGSDDGGGSGESAGQSVQLSASEFEFTPSDVSVTEAGEVTFAVSNEGSMPHALEIEGGGVEEETDTIAPGESGSLTVDLEAGEYELYCPIGNHREQGMVGKLVVGGGAAGGAATTGETETGETDTGEGYGYGG